MIDVLMLGHNLANMGDFSKHMLIYQNEVFVSEFLQKWENIHALH